MAQKLKNILCELRCALLFAELGARCELLDDSLWAPHYAPDVHVVFSSGLELLIDVTRAGDTSPDVTTKLHDAIKTENVPYHVQYSLGVKLTVPGFDFATRREGEEATRVFVEEGMRALKIAHGNALGSGAIHIFRDRTGHVRSETLTRDAEHFPTENDINVAPGEEWLGCLPFGPVIAPHGTVGGGITGVHIVDSDKHEGRFLHALEGKAKRRSDLPTGKSSIPFLVAYYNDETEMMKQTVLNTITGSRTCYAGTQAERDGMRARNRTTFPAEIEAALVSPWEPLLTEWGYKDPSVGFTDFGAFTRGWFADLSGVIVVHYDNNHQFFPNPLASPSIRDIRLMTHGLPIAGTGVVRARG